MRNGNGNGASYPASTIVKTPVHFNNKTRPQSPIAHNHQHNMDKTASKYRQKTNQLYVALLLSAALAILQIIFQETVYLNKNMRHLHSPDNLDLRRFRMELSEVHAGSSSKSGHGVVDKSNISHTKDLLLNSGINVSDIEPEMLDRLPSLAEVEGLYGPSVVISGLETCETFRKTIAQEDAYIGPAGMFNTGTNLMANYISNNCYLPVKKEKKGKNGMRWQVPWGKHTPASWRLHNVAESGGKDVKQTDVLPVVTIKDPYTWMSSMCRHSYAANWRHTSDHCPNLVANDVDRKSFPGISDVVHVNVRYKRENVTHHESLFGLWQDWYSEWHNVDFPRLIVRYEDMLFRTEEVVKKVCECAGGKMIAKTFKYVEDSAKAGAAHKGSSGLISSMIRYGNSTRRTAFYTEEDLNFVRKKVDQSLFDAFSYKVA